MSMEDCGGEVIPHRAHQGRMKKLIQNAVLIGAAVVSVSLMHLVHLFVKDYETEFLARRGTFSHAEVTPAGGTEEVEKLWLTVHNTSGFAVECGLLVPKQKGKRYPAIVVLGGKATGKDAVDFALDVKNVILAAPDYRYKPKSEYTLPQLLMDVPAIRSALFDMVPAVMLLTDYLFTRPDVDTTKLVLVGYSFGAPFIPAILRQDRRAAAACIVYGGGDLRSLIRHNVRRYRGAFVSEMIGWMGAILLRPLEPLRSVEYISPLPLVMINGTADEQIPRANAELLYERAREPKKIIWLESMHVHPRNPELTAKIIATIRRELASLNILE
jgi:dienelactone hydrolase